MKCYWTWVISYFNRGTWFVWEISCLEQRLWFFCAWNVNCFGIITAHQGSCGKIMFSVLPVYHSVCEEEGVPVQGHDPSSHSLYKDWNWPLVYRALTWHPFCTALLQDMFKLVQLGSHFPGTSPPIKLFKLVHSEATTDRKRAVDIRLKCILVMVILSPKCQFFISKTVKLNVSSCFSIL